MKRLWDRIHVWLKANAPEVLASLRPGATDEAIRAAEREMGITFPEDVRAAYRLHDGQGGGQNFLYGREWHSLAEVVRTWRAMKAFVDDRTFAPAAGEPAEGEATRSDYWHPAWIPLASGDQGSVFCLDLAPAPDGDVGQIIWWWSDLPSPRSVSDSSFRRLLEEFADELEAGDWTMHPDFDGLVQVEDVPDDE